MLQKNGFNVPKSARTIRNIVINYAGDIRKNFIGTLAKKTTNGERYSLTFDEWSSLRNRRYMNINIHDRNDFYNLGLVRVFGSMPAEKCIELLEQKLNSFGIRMKEIVGLTTDGASVMVNVGKLAEGDHQLCFAHGIQLAVIDVLYKKVEQVPLNNAVADYEHESDTKGLSDEDSDDEDIEDNTFAIDFDETCTSAHFQTQLRPLILKIRKVVDLFRRSPTKNDEKLQTHVIAEFGKNVALMKDTKTRWNSLYDMLDRFQALKNCVQKGLIDIKSTISFSDDEFILLSQVTSALHPVKLAVEKLCSRNINLFSADITLKFMLDEISSQNNSFSNALKASLITRIKQRRTIKSDIFQYLNDPANKSTEESYDIFNKKISKNELVKTIASFIKRVSKDKEIIDDVVIVDNISELPELTLKEKLNLAIEAKLNSAAALADDNKHKDFNKLIRQEMSFYEGGLVRGKYLQQAYNYFQTVQPTSVEPERAFSAASLFCTKIRSSLDDDTLDALCFLRAYFLKEQKKILTNECISADLFF